MAEDKNKDLMEFSKNRQQLMTVSGQKQQLEMQSNALNAALEELKDSKNDKVFKIIGPIMIEKKSADLKKELTESKETVDLRLKTMKKQEDILIKSLNKLKSKIEEPEKK